MSNPTMKSPDRAEALRTVGRIVRWLDEVIEVNDMEESQASEGAPTPTQEKAP